MLRKLAHSLNDLSEAQETRRLKAQPIRGRGKAIADVYMATDVVLTVTLNAGDLRELLSGKEVEIVGKELKPRADQNNLYKLFLTYRARSGD